MNQHILNEWVKNNFNNIHFLLQSNILSINTVIHKVTRSKKMILVVCFKILRKVSVSITTFVLNEVTCLFIILNKALFLEDVA